jgi:ppGpp synthetase/RelA/SpoT-type nucleotidyltranferase
MIAQIGVPAPYASTRHDVVQQRRREGKNYEDPLKELTDLSGCRIICYYPDDIEHIDQLIRSNFRVDRKNSVKKDEVGNPKEFGYRSRHIVVSFFAARLKLPESRHFKGMKCEIQVRTALQHAWAAIEHKLQYKSREDVPKPIQRKFYQMSAMLEVADDQFQAIRDNLGELRKTYKKVITEGRSPVPLNAESLDVYLCDSEKLKQLSKVLLERRVLVKYPPRKDAGLLGKLLRSLPLVRIDDIKTLDAFIEAKTPNQWGDSLERFWESWRSALADLNSHGVPAAQRQLKLNVTSLVRLLLIVGSDKAAGARISSSYPFGRNLQAAVTRVLDQQ